MDRMRNSAVALILLLAAGGHRSTAFADEPAPAPTHDFTRKTEFAPKPSMTPALIATGITGAIVAAAAFSYVKFHGATADRQHDNVLDPMLIDNHYIERQEKIVAAQDRWRTRTIALTVGTLIAGGVTGYLWSRRDSPRRIAVTPTTNGAEISFARSF